MSPKAMQKIHVSYIVMTVYTWESKCIHIKVSHIQQENSIMCIWNYDSIKRTIKSI